MPAGAPRSRTAPAPARPARPASTSRSKTRNVASTSSMAVQCSTMLRGVMTMSSRRNRPGVHQVDARMIPRRRADGKVPPAQPSGNAMVESSAFASCRVSRRVCCTTMGTLDSTSMA
jgi:hypothetical protein